jgi:hypothetical protein
MYYLDLYGIKESNESLDNVKTKSPEFFLQIHNDLRSLNEMADLSDIYKELDVFVAKLPTKLVCSSIAAYSNVVESDPQFYFSGVDKVTGFSNLAFNLFSHHYEDDRYSIRSLLQSGVFSNIAFALLSGETLFIESENKDVALSLAQKFSILVPFFKDNLLSVQDKISIKECQKYSIVLYTEAEKDEIREINILDLDQNYYSGIICPKGSLVNTYLSNVVNVTERAFLIGIYSTLKKLSTDFTLEIHNNAHNPEESPKIVFSKCDEPIYRYWLYCFFNKQHCRPIIRSTEAKQYGKITIKSFDYQQNHID